MALSQKQVQERVKDGAIHCLITFEVVGKPAKHVEESLSSYIKQLKGDENIDVLKTDREKAQAMEGENEGFFGAFAEIELLLPNIEIINFIAFNLMPASIEILAPDTFAFESRDVMNWLNDLLSKLHEIAHLLRGERQRASLQAQNITRMLRNFIVVILAAGPKSVAEIKILTGVEEQHISALLGKIAEEGKVEESDGLWKMTSQSE